MSAGLPGPVPVEVVVTSERRQESGSILVVLSWSPPEESGGMRVDYNLTLTPSPPSTASPLTICTTNTTTTITIHTNVTYNVSLEATNCAGTSVNSAELTISDIDGKLYIHAASHDNLVKSAVVSCTQRSYNFNNQNLAHSRSHDFNNP